MTEQERMLLMQADDLFGLSMEISDLIEEYGADKAMVKTLKKVNVRVMSEAKALMDGLCGERSDLVKGLIQEADLLHTLTEGGRT